MVCFIVVIFMRDIGIYFVSKEKCRVIEKVFKVYNVGGFFLIYIEMKELTEFM